MLRHLALAAALALAALAPATAFAIDVGTAAAVNPATRGTPPGSGPRTITLGSNIVHNERITTDAGGLVQILFVDGTTLTMGPNSDLVIDTFFYDPNAGTADVALTMTKGVLRFIGGVATKTGDGASVTTPVGTIGIRGGIADIVIDPPPGTPQHIDMLFGREVTLQQGLGLIGRLYQGGYSLVMGTNGQVGVQKTPPEWSAQMQQALAGDSGTSGGASNSPDDGDVADSGVPGGNSANGAGANAPQTGDPPLTQQEIEDLLLALATYEQLRGFVLPPPEEVETRQYTGASAGMVFVSGNFDPENPYASGGSFPIVTTGGYAFDTATLTRITLDSTGRPLSGVLTLSTSHECEFDCSEALVFGDGTVTFADWGTLPDGSTATLTGSLQQNTERPLPPGVDYCECKFLDWGFWQVHLEATDPENNNYYMDVTNGTWIVGDITTLSDLDTLGVQETAGTIATYNGHAIGAVSVENGIDYLAAGNLDMTWSFANRTGAIAISNFDSHNFGGVIDATGQYFDGVLTDGYYGTGIVRGAFFNDGTTPAAGVGGDFLLQDGDWHATGIFAGERGPDLPYSP